MAAHAPFLRIVDTACDLALAAGTSAADIDVAALQARLEQAGAYLGRQW